MHKPIFTPSAPAVVGPYSQGIRLEGFIYASGQLPIHPATGEMPKETVDQTRQALENVRAVLTAAGSGLDKVVKVTVFLVDMDDFAAMNEVYSSFFVSPYPARSCVAVKALPRGARVEIEAIAYAPCDCDCGCTG